jgi:chromosome segregation ATPase
MVASAVQSGCRMSDEKPLPETLETIAAKIDALSTSIDARFAQVDGRFAQVDGRFAQVDARFAQVDARFAQIDGRFAQVDASFAKVDDRFAQVDARFDELKDHVKTELRVEIEAVNANVNRVYDAVIAQREKNEANVAEHDTFGKRFENHEVRILAVEHRKRARR